ncbi:MAG: glycosyltransferase [Myxococcales bacterium]|nr:glycosyltransferase [Myxococcales bacterium]
MNIDVVLLVLNEIDGLRVIVPQIPRERFHAVFAVDGGSNDGSQAFLQENGIAVVDQSRRGRGQAFALGVQHSTADAFIFFSPDGNEDPQDLLRIADELEAGADLVIASRMMAGAVNEEDANWLKPRRWVNNAFNLALNGLFNPHPVRGYITDSINGYRGLQRTALAAVEPFPDDYTVEYRMTARALQKGLKVKEFPTHERDRIGGETKVPSLQAGLRFIRALGEETVRRFRNA